MRHSNLAVWHVLAIASILQAACQPEPQKGGLRPAPQVPPPPPGPLFVVTEADLGTLDENRIGRVGFPGRPQLLERVELELPQDHPMAQQGGVLILEIIIGVSGRIVKARVLRGPETPELRANLVRCLRDWRFTPAMYQGEAWAVSKNVTFNFWPPGKRVSG